MAICHGLTRFIYDADNIRIVLQSGHCTYPDSNNGARGLHKLYAKLFLSYKVNTTSVIKISLYGTPLHFLAKPCQDYQCERWTERKEIQIASTAFRRRYASKKTVFYGKICIKACIEIEKTQVVCCSH